MAVSLTSAAFFGGVYGTLKLAPAQTAAIAAAPITAVAVDEAKLAAKAAVLYDLRSGRVLYAKNAYEQLPLASLTKVMAAEVVLSLKEPGFPVEITREHLRPEGDSGLKVGETWTIQQLVQLALVASSNDAITAAVASLGEDGVGRMNAKAKELGLSKTHFFNPTGLDVSEKISGAYGSAFDVARLSALFYNNHPEYFEHSAHPRVAVEQGDETLQLNATTEPLQDIPGFVAAKTGYTDLAGGNLVALFDLEPGLTVSAVVLGSTRSGRFSDIRTMIEAARGSLNEIHQQTP